MLQFTFTVMTDSPRPPCGLAAAKVILAFRLQLVTYGALGGDIIETSDPRQIDTADVVVTTGPNDLYSMKVIFACKRPVIEICGTKSGPMITQVHGLAISESIVSDCITGLN
jgi:hypothetical protein